MLAKTALNSLEDASPNINREQKKGLFNVRIRTFKVLIRYTHHIIRILPPSPLRFIKNEDTHAIGGVGINNFFAQGGDAL